MKFSEQWLRGWVSPQVDRDELVARLSMAGLEVDSVTPAAGVFSGVVVGEVLSTIRQLAQEKRTMVIVTHEMSFARDVADRAIFMDQGRIVEQGPAKALFANPQQPRTRQFLEKFLLQ